MRRHIFPVFFGLIAAPGSAISDTPPAIGQNSWPMPFGLVSTGRGSSQCEQVQLAQIGLFNLCQCQFTMSARQSQPPAGESTVQASYLNGTCGGPES